MKRSKMIKNIKSILATKGSTQSTIKTAKDILDMIEEAGMLPPGREEDKLTFSKLNGEVIGTSFEKYEWEPEDE